MLRAHRNDIVVLISRIGLSISDFEWMPSKYFATRTELLFHKPTELGYDFWVDQGKQFGAAYPGPHGGQVHRRPGTWEQQLA